MDGMVIGCALRFLRIMRNMVNPFSLQIHCDETDATPGHHPIALRRCSERSLRRHPDLLSLMCGRESAERLYSRHAFHVVGAVVPSVPAWDEQHQAEPAISLAEVTGSFYRRERSGIMSR
jgi:hypothetical protein